MRESSEREKPGVQKKSSVTKRLFKSEGQVILYHSPGIHRMRKSLVKCERLVCLSNGSVFVDLWDVSRSEKQRLKVIQEPNLVEAVIIHRTSTLPVLHTLRPTIHKDLD